MFKIQRKGSAATEAVEYIMGTAAEAITHGELLKLSSGKLTKASGTDAAEFVSLGAGTGKIIPVKRLYEDEVYQTTLSAAGTSLNIGDSVAIASDGLRATATTTGGVFTITEILDSAQGGKINGMFRRVDKDTQPSS